MDQKFSLLRYRYMIETLLRRKGKYNFLKSYLSKPNLLDVGCGNSSVVRIKSLLPDCIYTGIDVADYNQTVSDKELMDTYLVCEPIKFSDGVKSLGQHSFDLVISSHNIEHCDDPDATLLAMIYVLSPGGKIYLSFPSSNTINFPSRKGTLNYFDDNTHKTVLPNFDTIVSCLKREGLEITYSVKQYQPFLLFIAGFLGELISRKRGKVIVGTWEYYGFESIVHARKPSNVE